MGITIEESYQVLQLPRGLNPNLHLHCHIFVVLPSGLCLHLKHMGNNCMSASSFSFVVKNVSVILVQSAVSWPL